MRYVLGTEQECIDITRQEALDRGVLPDAVTKYWYDWVETATAGVWAVMVYDNKNPIAIGLGGINTTDIEPEWPAPGEMRK